MRRTRRRGTKKGKKLRTRDFRKLPEVMVLHNSVRLDLELTQQYLVDADSECQVTT